MEKTPDRPQLREREKVFTPWMVLYELPGRLAGQ
jgi:hypothetical protein